MSNGVHMNGHINGTVSDHVDIFSASSTAEIRAALDQLSQHEKSVTSKLDTLVASQKDLSRQLTRLDLARAQLGPQVNAVRSVSNGMLSTAASTADRISGAVKRLDQEQAAVKATLEVVEQVAELKSCVLGVHGSMGAPQDWETAASYLARASKIPDEVIDGAFAEEIVPTAEVPDAPRITLNQAAESLCGLFVKEFERATKEGDGGSVTRYFKLFPLIGRTDVGLDAYGRYVCGGVATRARSNLNTTQKKEGMFYAMALTKLFEHIAQIVDGHEPLVTRHYGPGMMTKVIERLQVEADLQGGIILDTWTDERHVGRKITDVKSYAFSFLVQSFLPSNKPSQVSRTGSPAVRDGGSGRPSEDEGVDMKEIDALLGEIALMLGRWALYARFIASKTLDSDQDDTPKLLTMPGLISHSNLQRKISEQLSEPFNVMSTFFFRRSVEKAFQMDEQPTDLTLNPNKPLGSNAPFITSAVDDVMYIVNQVLQRSLGTSQRYIVGSVVPSIARVLGSDFYGMVQRKMRDESYPKAAIQGALPPEQVIIAFLVLMNNLDVSTDYVRRIVSSSLGQRRNSQTESIPTGPALKDLFPFSHDSVFVETQLKNLLQSYETKTSDLLTEAVEVMLKQVMRPRLRPVLMETFRDIDYTPAPTDRASADTEDEDIVLARFERGWQAFTLPIKRIATDNNYDKLLSSTISHLAKQLERRIWSYYGRVNELGAIKMERDITGIINVAVKGSKYRLRDSFTRCAQMALILNMDDEEWDELERAGPKEVEEMGIQWQLDADERRRTRGIITDNAPLA